MAPTPETLRRLLDGVTPAETDDAWDAFLGDHSRLILNACRSQVGDYDETMDRYARVLGELQADDYRRLRQYEATTRARFDTWLVVVIQRICVDLHRQRYGRYQTDSRSATPEQLMRLNLARFVAPEINLDSVGDPSTTDPMRYLEAAEVHASLAAAIARLSAPDRLLIGLRFQQGVSVSEIAGLMAMPSRFHAHRRLKKILATLRQSLEEEGFGK